MACVRRWVVWPRGQHVADDGNEETERLPGSRPGRHHEALALGGERDRLLLVLVEDQRLIVRAEDVGTIGMQDAVCNQRADVRRALVAGVDLDQRLGPVAILRVDRLNLLADVRSVNRSEQGSEAPVLLDHAVAERKDVERRCPAGPRTVRARAWGVNPHHRRVCIS